MTQQGEVTSQSQSSNNNRYILPVKMAQSENTSSLTGQTETMVTKSDADSFKHFTCGAGSSLINVIITFPINKLMFRQQLYGFRTPKALGQLWREGFVNLYRGLLPPLVQKSSSTAIMFGLYNHFHHVLVNDFNFNLFNATLVASMCAGTCEATLVPFERIQTLLLDPKHHNTFRNSYHAFSSLYVNYSMKEYFRGTTAVLYRNGPSSVIFFTLRHPIKNRLPDADKSSVQNSINDFISGAMIGAMCSTIFYPVNVVKARMQSKLGGDFPSFYSTFKIVFSERNYKVRKLYRGMHINFGRSLLSWGIINAAYEFLMEVFYKSK
ncbi:mitochondrial nicotinamide adenine dinucleotide transporter SLC25A51 [Ciona intestinalis]